MKLGAIEAGGTKFVCAIANEDLEIIERISIPTTVPEETMKEVIAFFEPFKDDLAAIGIGSFGPIDVNLNSDTYGYITNTPKQGWQNYPFIQTLKQHFPIPMAWTTDVNAAAYGELKKGAAKGKKSCLYLTVGTGIGGGIVMNEQIINGYNHPELGHIIIRRHPDDNYQGHCPFHDDCLEGMASGPAIEGRCGTKGQFIESDDPVWAIEAYYLAQAIVDYTAVLSPEIVIFGGGVMKQEHLFEAIRESFKEQMNGYLPTPHLDEYIVPCALEDNAGVMGCLLLAQELI